MCCAVLSHSVMSDSLELHGLQPFRLLCPLGFSKQEYWSGLPCPSPGDLSNPGIELRSPALQGDSFLSEPPWKPKFSNECCIFLIISTWVLSTVEQRTGERSGPIDPLPKLSHEKF